MNTECECGTWSGVACAWRGDASETVIVEFMPEHLRGSHTDARNRGTYPANGARRIRVLLACAHIMLAVDGEWSSIIEE